MEGIKLMATAFITHADCARHDMGRHHPASPAGHHATRTRAMGFCLFNNVAVGAKHALEHHGVERVAIIDFDVHHGNGTEDIFSDDERVVMASIFQHPFYPYSGTDDPAPNMANVPLPAGSDGRPCARRWRESGCRRSTSPSRK